MILNISGRTDIVAFYSEWFKNRYQSGFVDVRNPINPQLVSRIYFKDVELIVFCTKNPHPIISFLPEIKKPILFHVTLTPYKKEIEPNVGDKREIMEDIKKLSQILGPENIYVRYDPIFISKDYNIDYHIKAFKKMCERLDGYVTQIIISFIDNYKNVQKNLPILKLRNRTEEELRVLATNFSKIAKEHHMTIQTCGEYNRLEEYGFLVRDCIPKELAFKLTKKNYPLWKSRNNKYCQCVEMVDIGAYNTCNHLCKYCYANFDESKIEENQKKHDPTSSLLIGNLNPEDTIKIRQ